MAATRQPLSFFLHHLSQCSNMRDSSVPTNIPVWSENPSMNPISSFLFGLDVREGPIAIMELVPYPFSVPKSSISMQTNASLFRNSLLSLILTPRMKVAKNMNLNMMEIVELWKLKVFGKEQMTFPM